MGATRKNLLDPLIANDVGVLKCCVSYNRHGGFCVPTSSENRPAARKILSGDVWEPDTLEFMVAHCGDGDIVHAGTYFGDFIPALSRACHPLAKLWAFEPNPENYRCAIVTIEINGLKNVDLRNVGLGSRNGVLSMKVVDDNGRALGGGSRLVSGSRKSNGDQFKEVDIVELDSVIPPERAVSIIQLDVEGFEKHVLAGAMQTIIRCKPILILETLPESNSLSEMLSSLGYGVSGKLHENTVLTQTGQG